MRDVAVEISEIRRLVDGLIACDDESWRTFLCEVGPIIKSVCLRSGLDDDETKEIDPGIIILPIPAEVLSIPIALPDKSGTTELLNDKSKGKTPEQPSPRKKHMNTLVLASDMNKKKHSEIVSNNNSTSNSHVEKTCLDRYPTINLPIPMPVENAAKPNPETTIDTNRISCK